MGDRDKMTAVRQRFSRSIRRAEEKAETDFIVADSDLKAWDARGADEGANRNARVKATNSMMQYYDANKNISRPRKYVVEAAYNVARMRQAADTNSDEWRKKTIAAFEKYKATPPTKDGKNEAMGSREAGMAAECEYTMVDQELKKTFDYDTGHHRYAGSSVDVIKKYQSRRRRREEVPGQAAARDRRLRFARVGDRRHLAPGQPLRLAAHRPLQHAPAAAQAGRRQDREALEALREERQPRRSGQGRPDPPAASPRRGARARARAQQRRRGDDRVLRDRAWRSRSATTCATPR